MKLKAIDRLKMFASLAEFIAPKQKRTTIEQEEMAYKVFEKGRWF